MSFALTTELDAQIRKAAWHEGKTRSDYVRAAIERALDRTAAKLRKERSSMRGAWWPAGGDHGRMRLRREALAVLRGES